MQGQGAQRVLVWLENFLRLSWPRWGESKKGRENRLYKSTRGRRKGQLVARMVGLHTISGSAELHVTQLCALRWCFCCSCASVHVVEVWRGRFWSVWVWGQVEWWWWNGSILSWPEIHPASTMPLTLNLNLHCISSVLPDCGKIK